MYKYRLKLIPVLPNSLLSPAVNHDLVCPYQILVVRLRTKLPNLGDPFRILSKNSLEWIANSKLLDMNCREEEQGESGNLRLLWQM